MRGFRNNHGNAAKLLLFFGIMILLFGVLSAATDHILISSDRLVPVRNKNIYRIQREAEDSIDIIFLGDSLSYSSFSPMVLWREYGAASFVCGQSGQKMNEAEDILRVALRTQHPRVVVLETNELFRNQPHGSRINDSIEAMLNYYIPLFRGHDVWKSLIMNKEYVEENYRGFAFRCTVKPYERGEYMEETDRTESMADTAETHLDNIRAMCSDIGAELVLVSTPSPANWNYERHNTVSAYAEDRGIPYIDMNLLLEEIGINWDTDSLDHGDHLNLSGAEKVTAFLGRYLADMFALPDHRGEKAYHSWETESAGYEEKAARYLAEIRGENR